MKIRSITCFYNPVLPDAQKTLENFVTLTDETTEIMGRIGFEVQTRRIATIPFPLMLSSMEDHKAVQFAQRIEADSIKNGFTFTSMGPALPSMPQSYELIPAMMESTQSTFFGGIMAAPDIGISLESVKACAHIIKQATTITDDGFTNLRFSALANVSPFTPFFPSAYSEGEKPAFSLAIESADAAIAIFKDARSLHSARKNLLDLLEKEAAKLTRVSKMISEKYGVAFKGIDISLAPFPGELCSLGKAIELLGPQEIGLNGSLAAAAFIADTLDRGKWLKSGFNGLMLPVLEDSQLAYRSTTGSLSIKDLLLYSAVCGTGLDTVPLPGNASTEQIASILLDVAALSTRLDKPLTARLMPIPGKKAGDLTEFDFDYFSNGRVLELPAKPLRGILNGDETFKLKPRSTYS